jgi:phosphate transport system permease protein
VTLGALFTPQWYETYPRPEHAWQSTGATDAFEPKLGLVPLVFGTLKATLYSLLFGVPIALLAAIYTSEFLPARVRNPVKSVIEIMAGLPSVVLGFLAALVIAPVVQSFVPSVLLTFLTIPTAFLLGSYLWQLLPQGLTLRVGGLGRFGALGLALVVAVWAAVRLGPSVEGWLFEGDMRAWLAGQTGEAWGGWLVLLVPLCAFLCLFLMGRYGRPLLRRVSTDWGRLACASADLGRFLLGGLLVLGLAYLGARLLGDVIRVDPRGSFVGQYIQRNALVVGFVMGFAIIPIVYTLAEDALSSVPSHLREGSLGAGATPWQTATRIIVPTAMSGLFSAVMIGLGRAVGETMIVLMAAGNTAIIDLNVFNGFRTLSANIATELPEAVVGDSHYRTLFLAGLLLFAMTFVVNTVAEVVRQRFRKRAFQL